jgi:phosphoribosyl 1,2-cyclic phosphodiesterase
LVIRFWGVRGSIPTPSSADFATSRYGGNTTCVSLRLPGLIIIIDAGSGLRPLGLELAKEMPLEAVFFFSHLHWDHIQGFPFFIPGFASGNHLRMYGPEFKAAGGSGRSLLEYALRTQQADVNFPVQLSGMAAKLEFASIKDGENVELRGTSSTLRITAGALNHPGGCFGYRFEEQGADSSKAFVYATDTEHLGQPNPKLQKLARKATYLYYDAQFTEEEYLGQNGVSHKNWGHSTWRQGLVEAQAAGVKHLLLGHHDPWHDDWAVASIESAARQEGLKSGLAVSAAYEGMEIVL